MPEQRLPPTEYDSLLNAFEGRPSTYTLIRANLDPATSNLRDPYVELPWDAHPSYEFKGPEFTPEEDAKLTAHNFPELSKKLRMGKLEKALLDVVRQPNPQTLLLFCGRFYDSFPRQLTQTMQAHFTAEPGLSGRCARFALWLSLHAPETPLCQAGLDLLSVCADGLSADELSFINTELLPLLGLHDDASIQVGQLVVDLHPDPAELLYELAHKVTGWAKVHYVDHLPGRVKPHMRRWLLEEGSFNDVIREYLTLICVEEGRLIDVLRQPDISPEDIVMAGDLLESLIEGINGPTGTILDYEDAPEAIIELWRCILRRP